MSQKNVQIPFELFHDLLAFHCLDRHDDPDLQKRIYDQLVKKLDQIVKRDAYTTYKTAETKEEQEAARKKYLDMIGMHDDFRW